MHRDSVPQDSKLDDLEEKKRAKREANRRSAQLSRARKKAYIEDLKQQNQDYQRCERILESHPDIIIAFGVNGLIDFANKEAAAIFGFTESQKLEGTCFFDLISHESSQRFQNTLQQATTTNNNCAIHFDIPIFVKSQNVQGEDQVSLNLSTQCTRPDLASQEWTIVVAAQPQSHHAPPNLVQDKIDDTARRRIYSSNHQEEEDHDLT